MVKRNCPNCGKEISYTTKYRRNYAERDNTWCNHCTRIRYSKTEKPFIGKCFDCGKELRYKYKFTRDKALKDHARCRKCCAITKWKKGNIPWNAGTKGLMPIPWNTGLTWEMDNRVARPWLGKKRDPETMKKIGKKIKEFYEKNPEARGKSKRIRISRSHRFLFEELKKIYENVKIEYYHKGYFIDILVDDRIAIEVDGAHWHNTDEAKLNDKKRDSIISKSYKVYRINPDNLIFDDTQRILKEIKSISENYLQ